MRAWDKYMHRFNNADDEDLYCPKVVVNYGTAKKKYFSLSPLFDERKMCPRLFLTREERHQITMAHLRKQRLKFHDEPDKFRHGHVKSNSILY